VKKLILAIAAFSFLAVSQAKADDAATAKTSKTKKKAHKGGKKSKKNSDTTTPAPK
jgi:Ni/Co efflux regulator RcnB